MRFRPMVLVALLLANAASGQAPSRPDSAKRATVRAVLFYSPTCPHCRDLIANKLPPLRMRYGAQLQIAAVDASTSWGYGLYNTTLDHFGVPSNGRGVPTLVVGKRVLVGDDEIPAELPGIVERGLASGGVDWPDVPLLRRALATQGMTDAAHAEPESARPALQQAAPQQAAPRPSAPAVAAPATTPTARIDTAPPVMAIPDVVPLPPLTVRERFGQDPIGNTVAVVVLVVMAVVLVVASLAMRSRRVWHPPLHVAIVPVLALIGVGVASYLTYVELTGARAICGPVGDCNTVQQSTYARLFGIPVGLLGIGGYLAILAAWAVAVAGEGRTRAHAWLAVWGMAWVATLFSMYLTFLEPFVIGATCAWCISSALIVTLILLVATPAAARDYP